MHLSTFLKNSIIKVTFTVIIRDHTMELSGIQAGTRKKEYGETSEELLSSLK